MVALVPVIDMLDHNPAHRVSWTTGSEGDQGFQLVTHSGVAKVRPPFNGKNHDQVFPLSSHAPHLISHTLSHQASAHRSAS